METTYIYTLTDPETLQIRYVGKTNNLSQRYKAHLNKSRKHQVHKKNWIESLRKKKLKPIVEILDVVPINEWVFWETYWISQVKEWGFNLINYTNGGDGCTFGNKTSFKKGEGAIPILQIDTTGKIIQEFESFDSAKKSFGMDMFRAIDQERISTGGFLWLRKKTYESFSKEEFENYINAFKNRKRKQNSGSFKSGQTSWRKGKSGLRQGGKKKAVSVLQLDLNGNFIKKHYSCKEAAKEMGCIEESIRLVCVNKNKTAKGFIWKYNK